MTYANGRVFHDADSHIMEIPGFADAFADAAMRDRIPALDFSLTGSMADAANALEGRTGHDPETVAELEKDVIGGKKGWEALGAFNSEERSRVLDLLGFQSQLIFPSLSFHDYMWNPDLEARYASARAYNRAITNFCADDERMLAVGIVSLDDLKRAEREIDAALNDGIAALWIPSLPAGDRSPGHDDLDRIWARLSEARVPFVLHISGSPMQIRAEYMNTGRPVANDWLGGGEAPRAKDMTVIHHDAEAFLSTLVLDGVLERFPGLRGGVIELGAGWVPGLLARLDFIVRIWGKSDESLRALPPPSEQMRDRIFFTPFVFEDIGEIIRHSDPAFYLFSSDYPHIEGGRDPLARFDRSLQGLEEGDLDRFYAGNFERMMGTHAG